MHLEVLHFSPLGSAQDRPPVLLIHGAFVAAWSWNAFAQALAHDGWDCCAVSLPGHGGSEGSQQASLEDYVVALEEVLHDLPRPPIVIGHSLGGYLAQILAQRQPLAGLVSICAVPPYGLASSVNFMMFFQPFLLAGLNAFAWGLMPQPGAEFIRELLFTPDVSDEELNCFVAQAQQHSFVALTQLWIPQPWRLLELPPAIPCLVLGAERDRMIPWSDVWMTAQSLRVPPVMIEGAGHFPFLGSPLQRTVHIVRDWLELEGFSARRRAA